MQFISVLSIYSLVSIISIANAAPINVKSFELMAIHSGSSFQFSLVYNNDGSILVGTSNPTLFAFEEGVLIDNKTGKFISLDNSNYLVERDQKSTNFGAIPDDHLMFQGGESFLAYLTNGEYKPAANIICDGGIGVRVDINLITSTASANAPLSTTTPESVSFDEYFGVLTIRSSSILQYNSIMKVNSHPHVFSVGGIEGTEVEFKFSEDGTLVDQDKIGIYVDANTGEVGMVDPCGDEKPSTGFSIKDENLIYNDNNFLACPSGKDIYSLSVKDCEGGLDIALRVVKPKNS